MLFFLGQNEYKGHTNKHGKNLGGGHGTCLPARKPTSLSSFICEDKMSFKFGRIDSCHSLKQGWLDLKKKKKKKKEKRERIYGTFALKSI